MRLFFSKIYSNNTIMEDKIVEVSKGAITSISDVRSNDYHDFSENIATPGFVDIHTHGVKGIDSYSMTVDQLMEWHGLQLAHGTHYLLPTIVSAPIEKIRNFLGVVREGQIRLPGRIIGARLEGPLISPLKKGAHDLKFLMQPDKFPFEELLEEYPGTIKIVDIAPELPGAIEAISKHKGIIFSMGHTDCKFEECMMGYTAGSSHVTHLFNAMREFHHRETGLIGLALTKDGIKVEIITDLIHLSPETIKIVFRSKRIDDIIVITDSIQATLMPDGNYTLGSLEVEVRNNVCKIKGTDTIAGSTLTMDKAFKNLISLGFKPESIINTLTLNPARVVGLKAGLIKEGYDSAINIWDKDFQLKGVVDKDDLLEVK